MSNLNSEISADYSSTRITILRLSMLLPEVSKMIPRSMGIVQD